MYEQTFSNQVEGESWLSRCPSWQNCNAPICPLDANYALRKHQRDEPVCFYLGEYVKLPPDEQIRWGMEGFCPPNMEALREWVKTSIPPLEKQLSKMALTPSRRKHSKGDSKAMLG